MLVAYPTQRSLRRDKSASQRPELVGHMNAISRIAGALMTAVFMLLAAIMAGLLLQAGADIAGGRQHTAVSGLLGEVFALACLLWYFNLMAIFSQLRKLDRAAYDEATGGIGFMAYFWSSRSSASLLYSALCSIEFDNFPSAFRRSVGLMRVGPRILGAALGVMLIGIAAAAFFGRTG